MHEWQRTPRVARVLMSGSCWVAVLCVALQNGFSNESSGYLQFLATVLVEIACGSVFQKSRSLT